MLDGIPCSGGSGGDLDFVVDGGEVAVDGAGADRELISLEAGHFLDMARSSLLI